MREARALERGRESFDRKAWADSYRLLQAAEQDGPLEPEDLERLATAAYLMGRDEETGATLMLIQNSGAGDFESFYLKGVNEPVGRILEAVKASRS